MALMAYCTLNYINAIRLEKLKKWDKDCKIAGMRNNRGYYEK